ncbi:MAG: HdeD family acid-resistance protein [Candidatus Sulfotelmatobacter sp.]
MFGPFEVIVGATPEMIHNWGWFLAFGIVLLLLGIAAVVRAVTATVASMVFFGWVLLFSGILEFVHAFMVGKWAGFFLHILVALLFGITGALMVFRPVISAEAVTFVMSVFFLVAGLYQLIASMWTHLPGWGWQAVNGGLSAIMGVLLLMQWPASGLWVVGLFIGIDLIFYGWAWIVLAVGLHKM